MKKQLQKELSINFVQCVTWEEIKQQWGKREFNRFSKWMAGQTISEGGVYIEDVLSYARQRNRGIKDPVCYD